MARVLGPALVLTLLTACGAAARGERAARLPAEHGAAGRATGERGAGGGRARGRPCAGHDGLALAPPEIASRWDGGAWCGRGLATITRIEIGDDASGRTLYELDAAWAHLTYGESLTRVVTGRAAPATLTVRVTGEVDGAPIEASVELASVEDPELAAARAVCAAEGGRFGPVGMAQSLACTRPTHDAGRRCLSSADCEGLCIAERFEDAASSPDGRDCPEGTRLRVHVGHCDEIVPRFGCVAELHEPESACFGPRSLGRSSLVCHD